MIERPIIAPPRLGDEAEWAQVNALFRINGHGDPPWRLRDELVGWLVWARYGEEAASIIERLSAIEQERDALREALREWVAAATKDYSIIRNPAFDSNDISWLVKRSRAALNQTRPDASEAPDGH